MARVVMSPVAQKDYLDLPRTIRSRVDVIVVRLAKWPKVSGAKPLRHELAGQYRVRTGDYRVQFRIEGEMVVIVKVAHRDGFYDG